ncbi:Hint domain-containing protein [Pseudoxanthobacter sp. M-2]|uniref:Hint domain-containing protein n=1 Tax=Pseudoxanthobacter sp. M-2 TaxID=3078754 RepID=UPI0038FCDD88
MATFASSFLYYIVPGAGANYTVAGKQVIDGIAEDSDPDSQTFEISEQISYLDDAGEIEAEYIGYFGDGWVGSTNLGGFTITYLFSTDGSLAENDIIQVQAVDFTVCFLAGTAIACPGGDRPIEDLAVGDLVLTADGGVRPVRFVGRQTFATLFADPRRTRPIRIAAGALGEGLPLRDLCVSPDHALLVDGVLVQAGALVNGTTIAPMLDLPERFTYFHVELADHALILAEGVPAETFVNNVTRRRFDNYADYVALYGEGTPTIAEMALPRIKSARQVPRTLRRRLAAAAGGRSAAA